ncbi:hypothetical protein PIB30_057814 [Stylosanthes scabra]|uniref:Uncharacterized protein n=1 Tax=Stylosanthes scabra TaxID=79078 RepID=A0ABU6ZII7_9FABA|nr:hypothetical protein [Stylosanthes scabra]
MPSRSHFHSRSLNLFPFPSHSLSRGNFVNSGGGRNFRLESPATASEHFAPFPFEKFPVFESPFGTFPTGIRMEKFDTQPRPHRHQPSQKRREPLIVPAVVLPPSDLLLARRVTSVAIGPFNILLHSRSLEGCGSSRVLSPHHHSKLSETLSAPNSETIAKSFNKKPPFPAMPKAPQEGNYALKSSPEPNKHEELEALEDNERNNKETSLDQTAMESGEKEVIKDIGS